MTLLMDTTATRLVRLHLADPDNGSPLLSDDDLHALYESVGGNTARTIAAALRVIAASEVLVSKKIRTQDLSTDGPAVAAELRAQAKWWDDKADAEDNDGDADGYVGYVPGTPTGHREAEEWRHTTGGGWQWWG